MKQVRLTLSPETLTLLRVLAAQRGLTMSQLVTLLIEEAAR